METEWTKVKDELPDDGAEVLTTRRSIIQGELFVRQETFHKIGDFADWDELWWAGDPIAWMPSPEPYREEEDE